MLNAITPFPTLMLFPEEVVTEASATLTLHPTRQNWLKEAVLAKQRQVFKAGKGWTIQFESISETRHTRLLGKLGRMEHLDSGVWINAQWEDSDIVVTTRSL